MQHICPASWIEFGRRDRLGPRGRFTHWFQDNWLRFGLSLLVDNSRIALGLALDGDLRYVGECANLSARFNVGYGNISPKNCFSGGQETNCRLNNLLYEAVLAISLGFFSPSCSLSISVVDIHGGTCPSNPYRHRNKGRCRTLTAVSVTETSAP